MAWDCPHLGASNQCRKRRRPCQPATPGCPLYGSYDQPVKKELDRLKKLEEKEKRAAARIARSVNAHPSAG